MGPRGPSRDSKTQNVALAKTPKTDQFFMVFGVQRPPKRALGGPRRLPRGTQGAPKPNKKGSKNGPQNYQFLEGPFWGPFRGQNWLQNGIKNGATFGTLSLRLSGVRMMRFCKLNGSAAKATVTGIIFGKRKGGICVRAQITSQIDTFKIRNQQRKFG